ncbi:anti-sigma factor family protein [Streptomyces sp. 796.1]|uniref:anti-sigma factor family protein n=1 Tax=Streptomyces sp. 796.1 TaxID=3163029 RepID=UPI0039C917B1
MTSTTGTDEHPEVAEISALTEGVLPPHRVRPVREHLALCPLCADVHASLEEIRGLLGTLPGPARMPADVAGRIDAALAAEALLNSTVTHPEGADEETATVVVSRETATGSTAEPVREAARETAAGPAEERTAEPTAGSTRETADVSRETTTAGPDRPPGRARSATGPGRSTTGSGARPRRRRRWQTALLGTACAAAVLGVGTFLVQHTTDDDTPSPGPATAEGTAITASDLAGDVRALLDTTTAKPLGKASRGVDMDSSPNAPLEAGAAAVPSCVQQGTQRPEQPLAVKEDTYDGKPAYLVLLPHPGDDTTIDAFVIDAACTRESPSPPGTVLAQHSFPRHG